MFINSDKKPCSKAVYFPLTTSVEKKYLFNGIKGQYSLFMILVNFNCLIYSHHAFLINKIKPTGINICLRLYLKIGK